MNFIKNTLLAGLFLWPTIAAVNAQEVGTKAASSEGREPFRLQVPVSGIEGVDWAISQYFDHDPTSGVRDYRNDNIMSMNNGHRGIDFAIPSYFWMDNEDLQVFVLAAADGRVVDLHDGEFDRNTFCRGRANFVVVEHPNGFKTLYYHLKNGSIEVSIGQEVTTGQPLGIIGGSGCAEGPHLHFEVKDQSGEFIDPFFEELLDTPPSYGLPLGIMDYKIFDREINNDDVKDPGDNNSITTIAPKATFGIGLSLAGVRKGEKMRFVLKNGSTDLRHTYTFEESEGFLVFTLSWPVEKRSGTWTVMVYLNDEREPAIRHEVRVRR